MLGIDPRADASIDPYSLPKVGFLFFSPNAEIYR